MSVIQELPRSRQRFEPRELVRWLFVAVIALGTGFIWWTTPQQSSTSQLGQDLQEGRVTTLELSCHAEGGDGLVGFTVVSRPDFGGGGDGGEICWATSWGRSYAAAASDLADQLRLGVKLQHLGSYGLGVFDRSVRASAADLAPGEGPTVASYGDGTGPARDWVAGAVGLSVLGLFVTMVVGRQPRRGTRWGVFWVMTACSGLGTVWYLLRESPWNAEAASWPEPEAHETRVLRADGTARSRFSGLAGFGVALLTTIGLTALLSLSGLWDPNAPDVAVDERGVPLDGVVTWTVVGQDGRTGTVTAHSF